MFKWDCKCKVNASATDKLPCMPDAVFLTKNDFSGIDGTGAVRDDKSCGTMVSMTFER